MQFYVNIDFKKFKNAFVANIQGKTTSKRCICIPIDDNGLFCGEKSVCADMVAFENTNFGQSHSLRLSVGTERYNAMTDDEKKAIPYVGHMKEKVADVIKNATEISSEDIKVENENGNADGDLPF